MTQQLPNHLSSAGYQKYLLFVLFSLLIIHLSYGQVRYTLSGYVKDSLTGETLIGATLQTGSRGGGVSSNAYGFYSVTLPEGRHEITCSFVGYDSRQVVFQFSANRSFNFLLPPKAVTSQEIVVYGRRRDENVKNSQMGRFDLSVGKVKGTSCSTGRSRFVKNPATAAGGSQCWRR